MLITTYINIFYIYNIQTVYSKHSNKQPTSITQSLNDFSGVESALFRSFFHKWDSIITVDYTRAADKVTAKTVCAHIRNFCFKQLCNANNLGTTKFEN